MLNQFSGNPYLSAVESACALLDHPKNEGEGKERCYCLDREYVKLKKKKLKVSKEQLVIKIVRLEKFIKDNCISHAACSVCEIKDICPKRGEGK